MGARVHGGARGVRVCVRGCGAARRRGAVAGARRRAACRRRVRPARHPRGHAAPHAGHGGRARLRAAAPARAVTRPARRFCALFGVAWWYIKALLMLIRNLDWVIALPMSDATPETLIRALDLEYKIASPTIVLEIIQEIENNFLRDNNEGDEEFVHRMELLFGIIDQYKFLFPFKASRLYEVCFFKKLLLRVYEEETSKGNNGFCFGRLIMIVLEKQKHEFGNEFYKNVYKLLHDLIQDLDMLTEDTKKTFQSSLNLEYLHYIASETGKNHLKAIEQCFQEKRPDQAMASIQTNHFLYSYLEMLHRIWSFAVDVEPICTWPAFNSTMQMHHDIIQNLQIWFQNCTNMIDEHLIKIKNMKADKPDTSDEDSETKIIKIVHNISQEIGFIVGRMHGDACLKYAGENLEKIQEFVMTLWCYHHPDSNKFSNDLSSVYRAYCEVKCHDNKDKILQFKPNNGLELTEDNVKTVTQAMLKPSAYLDFTWIDVPDSYMEHLDELFTVKTGGNVVLSKDPICQQIINLTLANFGIILRHNSSFDDSKELQKYVKASLGIITQSSDDAYLDYFRRMPFQKKKIQGSWDITLDTEDSLSKISIMPLHDNHPLYMFFDDDGLDLSGSHKMWLLSKFISSRFFEFCKPLKSNNLPAERTDDLFNSFQQTIVKQRFVSCKQIADEESTDDDPIGTVRMYERLYSTYDGCEKSIGLQIEYGKSSIESEGSTEMKTGNNTPKGFMRAIFETLGTGLVKLVGLSQQEVSEPPDATFENIEQIDTALQRGKELKGEAEELATAARNEADQGKQRDLYAQCVSKKRELDQICTQVISFLKFKRDEQMSQMIEQSRSSQSDTSNSISELVGALNTVDLKLRDALDLQGEYGTWSLHDKPSEASTGLPLMPSRRESVSNQNQIDDTTRFSSMGASVTGNTDSMSSSSSPRTQIISSDARGMSETLQAETPRNSRQFLPSTPALAPAGEGSGVGDTERVSAGTGSKSMKKEPDTEIEEIDERVDNSLDFNKLDKMNFKEDPEPVSDFNVALELSSNKQSLPIAPINQMEKDISNYVPNGKEFSDQEMNRLLARPEFREIFLPEQMKGFDPNQRKKSIDNECKLNILAYFNECLQKYKDEFQFSPAHAFVLVNSTNEIRGLARRALVVFNKQTDQGKLDLTSFCLGPNFKEFNIPYWINEKYLSDVLQLLPMPKQDLDVNYILKFDSLSMFKKGSLNRPDIKLKARFLLYIGLAEKGIQESEAVESKKTPPRKSKNGKTTNQKSNSKGLFTQSPAWCDDSAVEGPPESTRVCCRCGMCCNVVRDAEKTDLLAYRTAPPAHPLVHTFSTHPAYSAPSRLVFAAAPMPGTPAQQVYILRL